MKLLISILAILLLSVSCSIVHVSERKNFRMDKKFTGDNVDNISGTYLNKGHYTDTIVQVISLWQKLFGNAKSFDKWTQARVNLQIVNRNKIEASLFIDTVLVEQRRVAFKITNGYLKLKRQYKTASTFGPLIWVAATFQVYLGLTTDDQLVIINAHSGIEILTVLPFYFTSNQDDHEYLKL